MISSPHTSVTPQQDLARLTLMTTTAEEKIRRKSTLGSAGHPSLGHINGLPIFGPAGAPAIDLTDVLAGEAVQSPTALEAPISLEGRFDANVHHVSESSADLSLKGDMVNGSTDVDMTNAEDNSSEA